MCPRRAPRCYPETPSQQPVAACKTLHASAIRDAGSRDTLRRKLVRGIVWTLSKFTTQSVGTPSPSLVNSSSDTSPRRVFVSATTTTAAIRSATGSRVTTKPGLSPPGVAANQTSPHCISPVRPVLGRAPIGDLLEGTLAIIQRQRLPPLRVVLACQTHEVVTESLAQELRAVDAEPLRSALCVGCLVDVDPEAQHCHTETVARLTARLDGWRPPASCPSELAVAWASG